MSDDIEIEQNNKFWLIIVVLVVGFLGFTITRTIFTKVAVTQPEKKVIDTSVNTGAALTPAGDPLPSAITQDVEIKITALVEDSDELLESTIRQDGDNLAWEVEDLSGEGPSIIRFVNNKYFIKDDISRVWSEIPPEFQEDIPFVKSFLFGETEIKEFLSVTIQLPSMVCSGEPEGSTTECAIWESETALGDGVFQIQVNKLTRKVQRVILADDFGQSSIVAAYSYFPITIEEPEVEDLGFEDLDFEGEVIEPEAE